jgi:hypothetical protein
VKARAKPAPRVVGDLAGGEFARVPCGLVRITQRHDVHDGQRWAILLRPDFTELPGDAARIRLSPRESVAVIPPPERAERGLTGGGDVDPLRGEP